MYKIYFKQAWQMLMQNRFISIIAILGTALAIMMILVIVMADTVQNADAAPESNRSRTLYIEFLLNGTPHAEPYIWVPFLTIWSKNTSST